MHETVAMNVAFFDCFNGAGGDMIVASLLDAGADAAALRTGLASLHLHGYDLSISRVNERGFAATRFRIELTDSGEHPHRHLRDVIKILEESALSESVVRSAMRIFKRLAEAEAKVHGISVDEVHFHEVGAVDAILDVTGAVLALESLGVKRVVCSPIPTGSGTVTCDHGVIPIPAPATAELLKGVPVVAGDEVGELTTPTAAAVLTTLADQFGSAPSMSLTAVGYGAGSRKGVKRPNLLRVMVGETDDAGDTDEITVLETNLDDVSGEVVGHCMGCLLDAGALDVYAVPIHMKKSRTGVVLTVLCEHDRSAAMERIVFAETTTFGIRRHSVARVKMRRHHRTVQTAYGKIRLKVGERDGVVTVSPEYEDCNAAARRHRVPLRTVIAGAHAAWAAESDK